MDVLAGEAPGPRWLDEVTLAERLGWTYDDIQEAPDWWIERALLWFDVRTAWRNAQSE